MENPEGRMSTQTAWTWPLGHWSDGPRWLCGQIGEYGEGILGQKKWVFKTVLLPVLGHFSPLSSTKCLRHKNPVFCTADIGVASLCGNWLALNPANEVSWRPLQGGRAGIIRTSRADLWI